jgi:hypothetical protein
VRGSGGVSACVQGKRGESEVTASSSGSGVEYVGHVDESIVGFGRFGFWGGVGERGK